MSDLKRHIDATVRSNLAKTALAEWVCASEAKEALGKWSDLHRAIKSARIDRCEVILSRRRFWGVLPPRSKDARKDAEREWQHIEIFPPVKVNGWTLNQAANKCNALSRRLNDQVVQGRILCTEFESEAVRYSEYLKEGQGDGDK